MCDVFFFSTLFFFFFRAEFHWFHAWNSFLRSRQNSVIQRKEAAEDVERLAHKTLVTLLCVRCYLLTVEVWRWLMTEAVIHSRVHSIPENMSIKVSKCACKVFLFIGGLPLHLVPVARAWRHAHISIMYAELIPLPSTNGNARLSSPARKRIPSFHAFFPALAHRALAAPPDLSLSARDLSSALRSARFQSGASRWDCTMLFFLWIHIYVLYDL